MAAHAFQIPGSDGVPIRGDLHVPAGAGPFPVVVGIHGFKGFRNWGFWPHIASGLAARGIACVRFDSSQNGVGEGGLDFDEKDLFERNTWAREEHDLRAVVAAVRAVSLPGGASLDPARLGLVGHSRGGGGAVVFAAGDPGVRAVSVLAPIATIDRFPAAVVADARRNGFLPILNTRTGETLRVGLDALDEIERRTDLHDIAASYAARMTQPLLVTAGTADTSVSPSEGARIAAAVPDPPGARFVAIEGADHVLGCRHPWAGATPEFSDWLARTADFFDEHLRPA